MTYYIDPINGTHDGSAHSPKTPRRTYTDLPLSPGDTVLFKRGSFIRDSLRSRSGEPGRPITYGAYGEGAPPTFCGSVDVSDPDAWDEIRPNVWKYARSLGDAACNFIYDYGRIGGTMRWSEDALCAQGDWYDSRLGDPLAIPSLKEERVLLYSPGNPGKVYSHIECALRGEKSLCFNKKHTVYEDLCFFGAGVHALSGGSDHVTVRRCSFLFIGGCVWSKELKIRYGNAIEFWQYGEDILIEDCYFNNIYDSAITHQGPGRDCEPGRNIVMHRNLFINYGMGAYEGRDRMTVNAAFTDNICLYAGGGFSAFGDTTPRNSEIYPLPMGHHLFMWRIESGEEDGLLEVSGNLFWEATGGAVYSVNTPAADAQMKFSRNRYHTSNAALLSRINGRDYAVGEFDEYRRAVEEGAVLLSAGVLEMNEVTDQWFKETGCDRCGVPVFTDSIG